MKSLRIITFAFAVLALSACCNKQVKESRRGPFISDETTITSTLQGPVQGYKDGDVYTFKGIAYAKAERFMPPVDPDTHEEVLKTRVYGPKAPQGQTLEYRGDKQKDYDFGFQFKLEPMDEEKCLVLNVWTKGLNDGRKRPVFVWFHGGGYSSGSAIDLPCYEGRALADKGDVVVVTVNHRLNVLGYLDMSGLGGKYANSANLGQQDLVKALEWVNRNIGNFGGDPSCVTIAGQSGGGGKVSTVMMMPKARGLFHRAIVQSGSFTRYSTNEYNARIAPYLLDELGIPHNKPELLADVPYSRLSEAANSAVRRLNAQLQSEGVNARVSMGPVIDGKSVIGPGFDSEAPEVSAEVPMIIGYNYNEFDYETGREDVMFRDGAMHQALVKSRQGEAPVYFYMFNWKPAGNVLGACHGMELPFMFNNIDLQPEMTGATPEAYALADVISSAWLSFIKTGDPNCKEIKSYKKGSWNQYKEQDQFTMIFE